MIPFSSFMQVGDMVADMGAKALKGAGTGKKGVTQSGIDSGNQFLAWVLNSLGRVEEMRTEGQVLTGDHQDDCRAESYNWEQLAALLADAPEQADGTAGDFPDEVFGNGPEGFEHKMGNRHSPGFQIRKGGPGGP